MRKTITLFILVTSVFVVNACGFLGEDGTLLEEDYYTIVEFSEPVSAREVFDLVKNGQYNPSFSITVVYGEQQSRWFVEEGPPKEQLNKLIKSEQEKMEFLVGNFDPTNEMEKPVYNELSFALNQIESKQDLMILSLSIKGDYQQIFEDNFVLKQIIYTKIEKKVEEEKPELKATNHTQAIVDWPDNPTDDYYIPIAGTSTIWTSGTLQKFWFDEITLEYLNNSTFGIEIDTIITPKSSVECGNGWDSNLPFAYKDTEASDRITNTKNVRTCPIGNIRADLLKPYKLYWTWHSFSKFNIWENPRIDIKFQPSKWCLWTLTFLDCIPSKAWCMCVNKDLPIRSLIRYYFIEAVGKEVRWYRTAW